MKTRDRGRTPLKVLDIAKEPIEQLPYTTSIYT